LTRARAFAVLGVAAAIVAILPLLTAAAGVGIARLAGCKVTAAGAQSCIIFGHDAGELIYSLSMSYWLLMFTALYVPVAIGLVIVAVRMRRKGSAAHGAPDRAGPAFWLVSIALMTLPLFRHIALFMLAIAALYLAVMRWREQPRQAEDRPPEGEA
jgi:heme/copper-type cytochrome/quinol oxidase subunit 2